MNDNDDIRREAKTRLHRSRADASVYCVRYHRDPLVHGEEEPGASSQHEQCIGHFVTLFSAPRRNWSARSWPHRGSVTGRSSIELRSGFHSLITFSTFLALVPRRCSGRGDL